MFIYLTADLTTGVSLKIVGPEDLRSALKESLEQLIEDILWYRRVLEIKGH